MVPPEIAVFFPSTEIYGKVYNSVIGAGVTIGKGAVVRDSIIMKNTEIGPCLIPSRTAMSRHPSSSRCTHRQIHVSRSHGNVVERCIIGEGTEIYGKVYNSVIGAGVTIGKGAVR